MEIAREIVFQRPILNVHCVWNYIRDFRYWMQVTIERWKVMTSRKKKGKKKLTWVAK